MHPAFTNAGKEAGIEIWRIENFEPVPYPKGDYGKFYEGDSYIVLHTKINDKGKYFWDIHFWLGLDTSQDEAGAAAIHTVHLDEALGGEPVQHRETEHHESHAFLSNFKNGVRYVPGGVASGFKQVEINAAGEKRLFQVKGKKNVRVRQVKTNVKAMNKGDCFILDTGKEIYVWVGKESKKLEKLKAINAANQIKNQDHGGRANVIMVDENASDFDNQKFFEALGSGSLDKVPEADEADSDEEFEKKLDHRITLYKISDASGTLKVETVSEKPLKQSMLKSEDCFILDVRSAIFTWVGKKATKQEKEQSIARAQAFLKTKKYPSWTQVHRIVENAETAPFKQYFATWRDSAATHSQLIREAMDPDMTNKDKVVDDQMIQMFKKSGGHALGFMPDNAENKPQIWLIQDDKLRPIAENAHGIFFGGDSYVVKYLYKNRKGECGCLIYYWLGKESSEQEKEAAEKFANKLSHEFGGKAIVIRIAHGYETRHFLKIFKFNIIFSGGHVDGFKNVTDHTGGNKLFRVRGTSIDDVRAEQCKEVAASLASDDVFILKTPNDTFIWHGKGGSTIEKNMAKEMVKKIIPNAKPKILEEGQETADFWAALGAKTAYDQEIDPPGAPILEPRMFHCQLMPQTSKRLQWIAFEEIADFEQGDLDTDDVMLLDGGDEVYAWIGSGTTKEEKEKALVMTKAYLKTDPTERNEHTAPIILIHQGAENPGFKRLLPKWNDHFWEN